VATNNQCGLGVYFFKQSEGGNNSWELTGVNHEFPLPLGTPLRFEPLVPEMIESETRIYATLIPGQKVSCHYKVRTSLRPGGAIRLEEVANSLDTKATSSKEKGLVGAAYRLFFTRFPQVSDAPMGLVFRFDVVHFVDKVYLNEVDIVPLAYLFLYDYPHNKTYLNKLSATMVSYITKNFGSWRA
jgi:hypothetical protein